MCIIFFYDAVPITPLGSARPVDSLDALLERANFVPESSETVKIFRAAV